MRLFLYYSTTGTLLSFSLKRRGEKRREELHTHSSPHALFPFRLRGPGLLITEKDAGYSRKKEGPPFYFFFCWICCHITYTTVSKTTVPRTKKKSIAQQKPSSLPENDVATSLIQPITARKGTRLNLLYKACKN